MKNQNPLFDQIESVSVFVYDGISLHVYMYLVYECGHTASIYTIQGVMILLKPLCPYLVGYFMHRPIGMMSFVMMS